MMVCFHRLIMKTIAMKPMTYLLFLMTLITMTILIMEQPSYSFYRLGNLESAETIEED